MKKLLSLFMVFVFILSGCSAPQSSLPAESQPVPSPEIQQTQKEYLVYEADNFTLYKGTNDSYVEAYGTRADYNFVASYKSGEYRIEIYATQSSTGDNLIIHMTDGEITGAMRFTEYNMYNNFGRWDLINADTNEKLTVGSLYCQHSGVTINYDFMAGTVTTDRNAIVNMGDDYQPRATRQDGLYTIYSHYPGVAFDEFTTWIRDNTTGDMTQLTAGSPDVTGFMADGNLFMLGMNDYKEMDVDGNLLFAFSDCYDDLQTDAPVDVRGVYKDVNHGRYYMVYYSTDNWEYVPGTLLVKATYKLAVLDESGAVKQIIETGKYVETSKNYAVELSVRSVNEYTISFYAEAYNSLWFEVFVDLNTEEITLLDYRQWE